MISKTFATFSARVSTGPHPLRTYSAYRQKFAERIRYHFHAQPGVAGSGFLAVDGSGDKAIQLYQEEMDKFDDVLFCESARWGYLPDTNPSPNPSPNPNPFTFSDPSYLPEEQTYGDWQRTTTHVTATWLPERRRVYFGHFAGQHLYVSITLGAGPSPKVGVALSLPLTVTGGTAPRPVALAYGTLPPGLSVSSSAIAGTPSTAGTYTFTLTATSSDAVGGQPRPLQGLTRFTLTVSP